MFARVSVPIAAAVLLSLPLACMAQVYKYKDAEGRTVFSDTPPPGSNAVKKDIPVTTSPPPGEGAPKSSSSLQDQMQQFEKRREERQAADAKAAKEKAERERAAEHCTKARNRLAALQSGQRIVRFNAQGEREYMDDAGREKEIADSQKAVSDWCK